MSIFPTIASCAGARHWSTQELRQLHALTAVKAPPRQFVATRIRRVTSVGQEDREMGTRALELGTYSSVGRSALGNVVAAGGPPRTATWRDAWSRKVVRGLLHQTTDPERSRLKRGHRHLGKKQVGRCDSAACGRDARARRTLAEFYHGSGPMGVDEKTDSSNESCAATSSELAPGRDCLDSECTS